MFTLIRLAFFGFLVAYLFSYNPLSGADLPMPSAAKGDKADSILPDLEEDTVTNLWSKVENFCSDHPTTCEIRDAALHMAHVQAAAMTGALHDWLAEGLEES